MVFKIICVGSIPAILDIISKRLTTFKKIKLGRRRLKRLKVHRVKLFTNSKFYFSCCESGIALSNHSNKINSTNNNYNQPLFEKSLYLLVLLTTISHSLLKYYWRVLNIKSVKDSVNQQVSKFVYAALAHNCLLSKAHIRFDTFFSQTNDIFYRKAWALYTKQLTVNNVFKSPVSANIVLGLKTLSLLRLFIRILNSFLNQKVTGLNWNSQLNFLKAGNYFFTVKDAKGYKNILFSPTKPVISNYFSTKLAISNQVSKNFLKWRLINKGVNILKAKRLNLVIVTLAKLRRFFRIGSLLKFGKLKYKVLRYINKRRLKRLFNKVKFFLRKKRLRKSWDNRHRLRKKRFAISFWNSITCSFDSSALYSKYSKLQHSYIFINPSSKHKNLRNLALSKHTTLSKKNFSPFFKKFILLNVHTTQNYKFFWKLFYFFNYHSGSRELTKNLETNILPNFSSFRLNFSKLFFSSKFSSFFRENATPWVYNTLTRFIEHYSGKKSLIQVYSFMNQSINEHYSTFYKLWLPRFSYYERRLGHRFFLEEAFHILHMSFNLQDSKMLSTWLKAIIQRISFWKTRFIFRFLRYLFNNYFRFMFNELGAKGFKVKLKGKISVAGNSRKRSILYRVGKTSHAECNLKVLHKFDTIVTFTGVMGFQVWIFY